MAENDQNNEEYTFEGEDTFNNDSMGDMESSGASMPKNSSPMSPPEKNIRRNALIAVGLIVFAMILYKFIGSMFSTTKEIEPQAQVQPQPIVEVKPQPISTITPTPIVETKPVIEDNTELEKRVSVLEVSQQSMKTELSNLSEQVTGLNNSISDINTKMENLNQTVTNLSNQVARQSEEISVLIHRLRPKNPKPIKKHVLSQVIYYIQAIIPGRAWLIGSNGSTLTVREGTNIPGYGMVKLIDSMEGRVLTSSGRVIRFSQEDS